jgi:hypothetical protein
MKTRDQPWDMYADIQQGLLGRSFPTSSAAAAATAESEMTEKELRFRMFHGITRDKPLPASYYDQPSGSTSAATDCLSAQEKVVKEIASKQWQRRWLYEQHLDRKVPDRLVPGHKVKYTTDQLQRVNQQRCKHMFADLRWGSNGYSIWACCKNCGASSVLNAKICDLPTPPPVTDHGDAYTVSENGTHTVMTQPQGCIMPDTGCRLSVAGTAWHQKTQAYMRHLGLTFQQQMISESFRFGDGQVVVSTEAFLYQINPSGKRWDIL